MKTNGSVEQVIGKANAYEEKKHGQIEATNNRFETTFCRGNL